MVNPASTTASRRTREVLVAAIEGEVKLDVVETAHRGHATDLARRARADCLDLVIAVGGDGTVNEVVNGLLSAGPRTRPDADQGRRQGAVACPEPPDLAVVPGGGTNVFARALGLPRDPVEATGALLTALREGRRRSVGLGQVDERWFTFNAGLGWDAEVVHAVDRRRHEAHLDGGVRTRASDYVRAAVRGFVETDRSHPALTVTFGDAGAGADGHEGPDGDTQTGLHLVMVANTAPWTYLGTRPIGPFPEASFDTGLDLYALRSLRTVSTLRQAGQVLSRRGSGPRGRAVLQRHDLGRFRVTASRPVALQVDGEPLGERADLRFRAVPDALRVVG